jgi:uncharacterized protein (DUF305 family)
LGAGLAAGLLLAGLIAAPSGPQTPPIFQPGPPGTPARIVSAREAVALSRTSFTAEDVAFMQHMIVHHGQAVEMVELLQTRGADAGVRLMGRRIALSQEAEIALMRRWLTERGQSPQMSMTADGAMDHADMSPESMEHAAMGHARRPAPVSEVPLMPGMLSPARMQALAAASGPAFDRLFLEGMIRHHQGALDMVDDLLARPGAAGDPMLSDFTNAVVADQSAEILRMQSLLSDL